MELACQCPAVVCCRCTPTQKAQIVRLLQERTGKLTCAVGEWEPVWFLRLQLCLLSSLQPQAAALQLILFHVVVIENRLSDLFIGALLKY